MAGPLTDEHRAEIDRQLAALKQARDEISRAKRAGIDVSDFEAQAATLDAQLRAIKGAYFPTGKT